MDIQLQELIEKIKSDGVAASETAASQIIAEAEKKAASIVADAERKAESIINNAKTETQRLEKVSVDAIGQAGRNLLISFRDGINASLNAIIKTETEKAYSVDLLKTLVPEVVKSWVSKPNAETISVLLSEKDVKLLESNFISALKAEIEKGCEIKIDDSLSSGFRIGKKDGSAFYDFSADSVAELFSSYLNPKISEILKNAANSIEGK
ncbi:MAG: V-type ATP synthase subunit E [Treponema sp.]|nr:V-type ATP synthase subunit E [Treponema sp.]